MRGLLEVAFYPFLVSKKLWLILIIGKGFEPYRLVKRANYLIYAILFWTVFSAIKEYIHTYKKYF